MPHDFLLSSETLPSGRVVYYAKLNNSTQEKFVIGYKTKYQENYGLYNFNNLGNVYRPDDFLTQYPFWSFFIYPTASAESRGIFNCLNTYDRAKFTFGFMQYAAHVPNGDFIKFFRKLLSLADAENYFPKLSLKEGRIHYINSDGSLTQLENDSNTQPLLNYFNPTLNDVETQELICSARMVHWTSNSSDARDLQVECAIDHFQSNMRSYHVRFDLHHAPAKVCQMICDIRHQGRGSNDRIASALATNGDYDKAFENLCTIGEVNYKSRIDTVKGKINNLLTSGVFKKKYNSTSNTFVDL